ncbi:MAG: YebC/PmpR family DNA-binding transcriptional regulator [Candidatus Woykebacteria bacterium]
MSGHSKWSTIKRQKGVTDAKRGQAFTRVANAITLAAREGGASSDSNFKLRLAIEAAKRLNMPKDNIERAVDRGVGKGSEAAKLEEVIYEGFGPAGVGVVVVAVTDNRLRTAQEVRTTFDRGGGTLGAPGSVAYLFSQTGEIDVEVGGAVSPDDLLSAAADAGADDVDLSEESALIYCATSNLDKIKKVLEGRGLKITGSEITMKPKNVVRIEEAEKAAKVLSLMDKLEELQDVQKVYANFDIPEEILEREAA